MKKTEIFILIFFGIILIVGFSNYFDNKNVVINNTITTTISTTTTEPSLLQTAKKDSRIINLLLNGGKISIGPNKVTKKEINSMPVIFKDLKGDLYYFYIESPNSNQLVIMNKEKIIKIVPITKLSLG